MEKMERTPLSCCHTCEGTPEGHDIILGGVNTYISEPPFDNPKRAVIIATDEFGYKLVHTRLVADAIAKEGFLVVVPDIFGGKSLPPYILEKMVSLSPGVGKCKRGNTCTRIFSNIWTYLTVIPKYLCWMRKFGGAKKQAINIPIYDQVIHDLKVKYDIEKIGMTGYSYGVYYCLHYGKDEADNVSACVTAHGHIVPNDIPSIIKPTLFICADNDKSFSARSRKKAQNLAQLEDLQFNFYPGTYRGFAIRGADCNETIERAKIDALNSTIAFFKKFLIVDYEGIFTP